MSNIYSDTQKTHCVQPVKCTKLEMKFGLGDEPEVYENVDGRDGWGDKLLVSHTTELMEADTGIKILIPEHVWRSGAMEYMAKTLYWLDEETGWLPDGGSHEEPVSTTTPEFTPLDEIEVFRAMSDSEYAAFNESLKAMSPNRDTYSKADFNWVKNQYLESFRAKISLPHRFGPFKYPAAPK